MHKSYSHFLYAAVSFCHFDPPNIHLFVTILSIFCHRCKSHIQISYMLRCHFDPPNLHFFVANLSIFGHRCTSHIHIFYMLRCHFVILTHQICTFLWQFCQFSVIDARVIFRFPIQGEHSNFERYVPIKKLFLWSHDFETFNFKMIACPLTVIPPKSTSVTTITQP
jgi:hypothetical protein